MNKIYKYAKKSVNKMDLSVKEKNDLKIQFVDHMNELYNNYKLDGFSDKDSLKYAIDMFNDSNRIKEKKYKDLNRWILLFFGIYCLFFALIFIYVSRQDVFKLRFDIRLLIPFRYLSHHLIQIINYNSINSINELKRQILLFLAFIPIGIFIPLVTSKYKSFISNFKKFVCITVGMQVLKIVIGLGRAEMDYILIHLLGCLIGYGLFKVIKSLIEKVQNK